MWRSAGSEGTGRDPRIRNSLHTVSIHCKVKVILTAVCHPPPLISSLPCSGAARRASAALLGKHCSRTMAALSAGKRGSDGALAPATVPLSGSGHHCSMSSHHAHHSTHALPPLPPMHSSLAGRPVAAAQSGPVSTPPSSCSLWLVRKTSGACWAGSQSGEEGG